MYELPLPPTFSLAQHEGYLHGFRLASIKAFTHDGAKEQAALITQGIPLNLMGDLFPYDPVLLVRNMRFSGATSWFQQYDQPRFPQRLILKHFESKIRRFELAIDTLNWYVPRHTYAKLAPHMTAQQLDAWITPDRFLVALDRLKHAPLTRDTVVDFRDMLLTAWYLQRYPERYAALGVPKTYGENAPPRPADFGAAITEFIGAAQSLFGAHKERIYGENWLPLP